MRRPARVPSVWGTSVSGILVILIALINPDALIRIRRVFRAMRHSHPDETELDEQLDRHGFPNPILDR